MYQAVTNNVIDFCDKSYSKYALIRSRCKILSDYPAYELASFYFEIASLLFDFYGGQNHDGINIIKKYINKSLLVFKHNFSLKIDIINKASYLLRQTDEISRQRKEELKKNKENLKKWQDYVERKIKDPKLTTSFIDSILNVFEIYLNLGNTTLADQYLSFFQKISEEPDTRQKFQVDEPNLDQKNNFEKLRTRLLVLKGVIKQLKLEESLMFISKDQGVSIKIIHENNIQQMKESILTWEEECKNIRKHSCILRLIQGSTNNEQITKILQGKEVIIKHDNHNYSLGFTLNNDYQEMIVTKHELLELLELQNYNSQIVFDSYLINEVNALLKEQQSSTLIDKEAKNKILISSCNKTENFYLNLFYLDNFDINQSSNHQIYKMLISNNKNNLRVYKLWKLFKNISSNQITRTEHEIVERILNSGIKLFKNLPLTKKEKFSQTYKELSEIYFDLGHTPLALEYYRLSLPKEVKINNPLWQNKVIKNNLLGDQIVSSEKCNPLEKHSLNKPLEFNTFFSQIVPYLDQIDYLQKGFHPYLKLTTYWVEGDLPNEDWFNVYNGEYKKKLDDLKVKFGKLISPCFLFYYNNDVTKEKTWALMYKIDEDKPIFGLLSDLYKNDPDLEKLYNLLLNIDIENPDANIASNNLIEMSSWKYLLTVENLINQYIKKFFSVNELYSDPIIIEEKFEIPKIYDVKEVIDIIQLKTEINSLREGYWISLHRLNENFNEWLKKQPKDQDYIPKLFSTPEGYYLHSLNQQVHLEQKKINELNLIEILNKETFKNIYVNQAEQLFISPSQNSYLFNLFETEFKDNINAKTKDYKKDNLFCMLKISGEMDHYLTIAVVREDNNNEIRNYNLYFMDPGNCNIDFLGRYLSLNSKNYNYYFKGYISCPSINSKCNDSLIQAYLNLKAMQYSWYNGYWELLLNNFYYQSISSISNIEKVKKFFIQEQQNLLNSNLKVGDPLYQNIEDNFKGLFEQIDFDNNFKLLLMNHKKTFEITFDSPLFNKLEDIYKNIFKISLPVVNNLFGYNLLKSLVEDKILEHEIHADRLKLNAAQINNIIIKLITQLEISDELKVELKKLANNLNYPEFSDDLFNFLHLERNYINIFIVDKVHELFNSELNNYLEENLSEISNPLNYKDDFNLGLKPPVCFDFLLTNQNFKGFQSFTNLIEQIQSTNNDLFKEIASYEKVLELFKNKLTYPENINKLLQNSYDGFIYKLNFVLISSSELNNFVKNILLELLGYSNDSLTNLYANVYKEFEIKFKEIQNSEDTLETKNLGNLINLINRYVLENTIDKEKISINKANMGYGYLRKVALYISQNFPEKVANFRKTYAECIEEFYELLQDVFLKQADVDNLIIECKNLTLIEQPAFLFFKDLLQLVDNRNLLNCSTIINKLMPVINKLSKDRDFCGANIILEKNVEQFKKIINSTEELKKIQYLKSVNKTLENFYKLLENLFEHKIKDDYSDNFIFKCEELLSPTKGVDLYNELIEILKEQAYQDEEQITIQLINILSSLNTSQNRDLYIYLEKHLGQIEKLIISSQELKNIKHQEFCNKYLEKFYDLVYEFCNKFIEEEKDELILKFYEQSFINEPLNLFNNLIELLKDQIPDDSKETTEILHKSLNQKHGENQNLNKYHKQFKELLGSIKELRNISYKKNCNELFKSFYDLLNELLAKRVDDFQDSFISNCKAIINSSSNKIDIFDKLNQLTITNHDELEILDKFTDLLTKIKSNYSEVNLDQIINQYFQSFSEIINNFEELRNIKCREKIVDILEKYYEMLIDLFDQDLTSLNINCLDKIEGKFTTKCKLQTEVNEGLFKSITALVQDSFVKGEFNSIKQSSQIELLKEIDVQFTNKEQSLIDAIQSVKDQFFPKLNSLITSSGEIFKIKYQKLCTEALEQFHETWHKLLKGHSDKLTLDSIKGNFIIDCAEQFKEQNLKKLHQHVFKNASGDQIYLTEDTVAKIEENYFDTKKYLGNFIAQYEELIKSFVNICNFKCQKLCAEQFENLYEQLEQLFKLDIQKLKELNIEYNFLTLIANETLPSLQEGVFFEELFKIIQALDPKVKITVDLNSLSKLSEILPQIHANKCNTQECLTKYHPQFKRLVEYSYKFTESHFNKLIAENFEQFYEYLETYFRKEFSKIEKIKISNLIEFKLHLLDEILKYKNLSENSGKDFFSSLIAVNLAENHTKIKMNVVLRQVFQGKFNSKVHLENYHLQFNKLINLNIKITESYFRKLCTEILETKYEKLNHLFLEDIKNLEEILIAQDVSIIPYKELLEQNLVAEKFFPKLIQLQPENTEISNFNQTLITIQIFDQIINNYCDSKELLEKYHPSFNKLIKSCFDEIKNRFHKLSAESIESLYEHLHGSFSSDTSQLESLIIPEEGFVVSKCKVLIDKCKGSKDFINFFKTINNLIINQENSIIEQVFNRISKNYLDSLGFFEKYYPQFEKLIISCEKTINVGFKKVCTENFEITYEKLHKELLLDLECIKILNLEQHNNKGIIGGYQQKTSTFSNNKIGFVQELAKDNELLNRHLLPKIQVNYCETKQYIDQYFSLFANLINSFYKLVESLPVLKTSLRQTLSDRYDALPSKDLEQCISREIVNNLANQRVISAILPALGIRDQELSIKFSEIQKIFQNDQKGYHAVLAFIKESIYMLAFDYFNGLTNFRMETIELFDQVEEEIYEALSRYNILRAQKSLNIQRNTYKETLNGFINLFKSYNLSSRKLEQLANAFGSLHAKSINIWIKERTNNINKILNNFNKRHEISENNLGGNCKVIAKVKSTILSDILKEIRHKFVSGDELQIITTDTVYLDVNLNTPEYSGVNISLIGPSFKLAPNLGKFEIDVSGKDAKEHESLQAENGKNGGQDKDGNGIDGGHGKDGLSGLPGEHSGNIFIIADEFPEGSKLLANGGNGGAGQLGGNGGNGGNGKDGKKGSKETARRNMFHNTPNITNWTSGIAWDLGTHGNVGGNGGNSGYSGYGGFKGNSGIIQATSFKNKIRCIHDNKDGISGKDAEVNLVKSGIAGRFGEDGLTAVIKGTWIHYNYLKGGKDSDNSKVKNFNYYQIKCYDGEILLKNSGFRDNETNKMTDTGRRFRSSKLGNIYRHNKCGWDDVEAYFYPTDAEKEQTLKDKFKKNTKQGEKKGLKDTQKQQAKTISNINARDSYRETNQFLGNICSNHRQEYQRWQAKRVSDFLNKFSSFIASQDHYNAPEVDPELTQTSNLQAALNNMLSHAANIQKEYLHNSINQEQLNIGLKRDSLQLANQYNQYKSSQSAITLNKLSTNVSQQMLLAQSQRQGLNLQKHSLEISRKLESFKENQQNLMLNKFSIKINNQLASIRKPQLNKISAAINAQLQMALDQEQAIKLNKLSLNINVQFVSMKNQQQLEISANRELLKKMVLEIKNQTQQAQNQIKLGQQATAINYNAILNNLADQRLVQQSNINTNRLLFSQISMQLANDAAEAQRKLELNIAANKMLSIEIAEELEKAIEQQKLSMAINKISSEIANEIEEIRQNEHIWKNSQELNTDLQQQREILVENKTKDFNKKLKPDNLLIVSIPKNEPKAKSLNQIKEPKKSLLERKDLSLVGQKNLDKIINLSQSKENLKIFEGTTYNIKDLNNCIDILKNDKIFLEQMNENSNNDINSVILQHIKFNYPSQIKIFLETYIKNEYFDDAKILKIVEGIRCLKDLSSKNLIHCMYFIESVSYLDRIFKQGLNLNAREILRMIHWLDAFVCLSSVFKALTGFNNQTELQKLTLNLLFQDTIENCFPHLKDSLIGRIDNIDLELFSLLYNKLQYEYHNNNVLHNKLDIPKYFVLAKEDFINILNSLNDQALDEFVINKFNLKKNLIGGNLLTWPDTISEIKLALEFSKILENSKLELNSPKNKECLQLLNTLKKTLNEEQFKELFNGIKAAAKEITSLDTLIEILKGIQYKQINITDLFKVMKNTKSEHWLNEINNNKLTNTRASKIKEKSIEEILEELSSSNKAISNIINLKELKESLYSISNLIKNKKEELESESSKKPEKIKSWLEDIKSKRPNEIIAILACAWYVQNNKQSPRSTQLTAVLLFIEGENRKNSLLTQIKTGEGKTLTVALISAYLAIKGYYVDVISSNRDLAIDGQKKCDEFFKLLGLGSAHNCEIDNQIKQKAYTNNIVYGEVSAYQGDILESDFNQKEIVGDRYKDMSKVCLIVDEVDSMCLDKANDVLYLSHSIEGLKWLESIFIYIWISVLKVAPKTNEELKSNVDTISQGILKTIEDRNIIIPKYMESYVKIKIKIWTESAFQAKAMNANDEFVIDKSKDNLEQKNQKRIIVLDKDVGVEQYSSRWSNGLAQFLELKFRRNISVESLKAVFMSNIHFFKRYEQKLYGLTGTLGNEISKKFLNEVYNTKFVIIPTAYPSQYKNLLPKCATTVVDWSFLIKHAVKENIHRPILIITDTVESANFIINQLKNENNSTYKIRSYIRDTDEIESYFQLNPAAAGDIVVATNKGGRGTDIKVSDSVNKNFNGMHVILTYLPSNERIEEQAFGRTARNGNPGTGQFIILVDDTELNEELASLTHEQKIKKLSEVAPTIIQKKKDALDYEAMISFNSEKRLKILHLDIEQSLFKEFKVINDQVIEKLKSCIEQYLNRIDDGFMKILKKGHEEVNKHGLLSGLIIDLGGYEKFKENKPEITEEIKSKFKKELESFIRNVLRDSWAFWLDEVQKEINSSKSLDIKGALINKLKGKFSSIENASNLFELIEFPEQSLKLGVIFLRYGQRYEAKNCFIKEKDTDPTGTAYIGLAYCEIPPDGGAKNKDAELKKIVRRHLKQARFKIEAMQTTLLMNHSTATKLAELTQSITGISQFVSPEDNFYCSQIESKLKVLKMHLQIINKAIGSSLENEYVFAEGNEEEFEKSKGIYFKFVKEGIIHHNRVRREHKDNLSVVINDNFDKSIANSLIQVLKQNVSSNHINQAEFEKVVRDKNEFWEILKKCAIPECIEKVNVLDLNKAVNLLPVDYQSIFKDLTEIQVKLTSDQLNETKDFNLTKNILSLIRKKDNSIYIYGKSKASEFEQTKIVDCWNINYCRELPDRNQIFTNKYTVYCVCSENEITYSYFSFRFDKILETTYNPEESKKIFENCKQTNKDLYLIQLIIGNQEEPLYNLPFDGSILTLSSMGSDLELAFLKEITNKTKGNYFQILDPFNILESIFDNSKKLELRDLWKKENLFTEQERIYLVNNHSLLDKLREEINSQPKYSEITFSDKGANAGGICEYLAKLFKEKSEHKSSSISNYLYSSEIPFETKEIEAKSVVKILHDVKLLKSGGLSKEKVNKYAHEKFKEEVEKKSSNSAFVDRIVYLQGEIRSYKDGLKGWLKQFTEISSKDAGSNEAIDIPEELAFYKPIGFDRVLVLEELKRFHFNLAALLVFILGACQVLLGSLLCAIGIANFGNALISEGVSDMVQGTIGMITGQFSLASWAVSKAISFSVSMLTAGIATLASIGNAAKTAHGTLTAGQIFVKTLVRASAEFVLNLGTELVCQYGLQELMSLTNDSIERELRPVIENRLHTKLEQIKSQMKEILKIKGHMAYNETLHKFEKAVTNILKDQSIKEAINVLQKTISAAMSAYNAVQNAPTGGDWKANLAKSAVNAVAKQGLNAALNALKTTEIAKVLDNLDKMMDKTINDLSQDLQNKEVKKEVLDKGEADRDLDKLLSSINKRITGEIMGFINATASGVVHTGAALGTSAITSKLDSLMTEKFKESNNHLAGTQIGEIAQRLKEEREIIKPAPEFKLDADAQEEAAVLDNLENGVVNPLDDKEQRLAELRKQFEHDRPIQRRNSFGGNDAESTPLPKAAHHKVSSEEVERVKELPKAPESYPLGDGIKPAQQGITSLEEHGNLGPKNWLQKEHDAGYGYTNTPPCVPNYNKEVPTETMDDPFFNEYNCDDINQERILEAPKRKEVPIEAKEDYSLYQYKHKMKMQTNLEVTGNTHECEHMIPNNSLLPEGTTRDQNPEARKIKNLAPAYLEAKQNHREHVGTGKSVEAQNYRDNSRAAISEQNGDAFIAIHENQSHYRDTSNFNNPSNEDLIKADKSIKETLKCLSTINNTSDTCSIYYNSETGKIQKLTLGELDAEEIYINRLLSRGIIQYNSNGYTTQIENARLEYRMNPNFSHDPLDQTTRARPRISRR